MSLTEDIAGAVAATDALRNLVAPFKADAEAALADALAAVPDMEKVFYVDQLTGSNANDGKRANPLQSIKEAFYRSPTSSRVRISLANDYHHDEMFWASGRAS